MDSTMTNDTMEPFLAHNVTHDLRKTSETVLATLFLLITILVALVGNITVIAGISLQHTLRSDISNLLIINLSITDLTSTVFIMLSAFISIILDHWPFGQFWCDCACALNYCLIIVSMLTLCCIAVDRYQAVMHPLSYEEHVTKRRIIAVIVYSWLQGMAFGIAPSAARWVSYDYWEAICAIQWSLYRPETIIYVVTAFLSCFLGPGIVLVYCYVKILKEVKKQKIQVLAMQVSKGPNQKMKKTLADRTRIVWSLLVVVFAYFICTAPFSVTKLIKVSVDSSDFIPGPINLVSALLGYVASAINPLIYGIFRRDFRNAYRRLWKRLFLKTCSNNQILTSNSTSLARRNPPYVSDFDDVTINKTITVKTDNITEDQSSESKEQMSISQISLTATFNSQNLNNILQTATTNIRTKSLESMKEGHTNNLLPATKKQPLVNGIQEASGNMQQKPVQLSNSKYSNEDQPQTTATVVHYQTIVVKSLSEAE